MPLALGFSVNQFVYPRSYYQLGVPVSDRHGDPGSTALMLGIVDGFRTIWANSLGLSGGNNGGGGFDNTDPNPTSPPGPSSALGLNAYLYPASFSIWCHIVNPTDLFQDPSPWEGNFPRQDLMDGLRLRGITPMLHWGLEAGNNRYRSYQWSKWSSGQFDPFLDMWADAIKEWSTNENSLGLTWQGNPKSNLIIVRLAWENNSTYMPWCPQPSTATTGFGGADQPAGTVAQFKAGFKYIHDYLRNVRGIRNVKFLYCPIYHGAGQGNPVSEFLSPNHEVTSSMTDQYPGDNACEYVGFDAYSQGRVPTAKIGSGTVTPGVDLWTWEPSIRAGWLSGYQELAALTNKPMIIGEFGVNGGVITGHPSGTARQRLDNQGAFFSGNAGVWESKAATKDPAGGLVWAKNNMPQIRGMQYFDFPPFDIDTTDDASTLAVAQTIDAISDGRVYEFNDNQNRSATGVLPPITGANVTEIATIDADTGATGTINISGSVTYTMTQNAPPDNASYYLYEGDDIDSLEPVWD